MALPSFMKHIIFSRRMDPDAQGRPRAHLRHREEAVCRPSKIAVRNNALSGKDAPTGSSLLSPSPQEGKIEMIPSSIRTSTLRFRADNQGGRGAAGLERMDGPRQLRAMVDSGVRPMQGLEMDLRPGGSLETGSAKTAATSRRI